MTHTVRARRLPHDADDGGGSPEMVLALLVLLVDLLVVLAV
jgi:hypothetical protein